jgi:hypothetical protein
MERSIPAAPGWAGELTGMIGIVCPSIPLNPPDGPLLVLDDEDVSRFDAVDPRSIFFLEAREIERLVPPLIDMGFAQPAPQQWKIGPCKCAKRDHAHRSRCNLEQDGMRWRARHARVRTREADVTWTIANAIAHVPKQWHHRHRVSGMRT